MPMLARSFDEKKNDWLLFAVCGDCWKKRKTASERNNYYIH